MFSSLLITVLLGWQLQGSGRQTLQVTERASIIQPASKENLQSSNEDSDNLQPAAGYSILYNRNARLEVR